MSAHRQNLWVDNEPTKSLARTLRAHRPLILDWFRAREQISLGATAGMNNQLEVVTHRAYGFHSAHLVNIALDHPLGALPEPEGTHRLCRGGSSFDPRHAWPDGECF